MHLSSILDPSCVVLDVGVGSKHEVLAQLARPIAALRPDLDGAAILAELESREGELLAMKETPLVVHCHHGGRSEKAARWLLGRGFSRVENLEGGIEAWSLTVDPKVPRY